MPHLIEELAKKRNNWVTANKENNFETGLKRLLTDLYPDNAHFIYELLQNAEDSGANVVRFILTDQAIEFEHDSTRLFDLRDVESITSIGSSTKRDDHTAIGEFGVGFKAVFAYTNTPEIHSGTFHFRIHDLVVPEVIGLLSPIMDERTTRFIFPFDHPTKNPAQSLEEIDRGLRALNDNTLLFLNNIHTIEYLLPDSTLGSLKRVDKEQGHIEIRSLHPGGQDSVSHWLRFQKDVEVTDDDDKLKACKVAIAYNLIEEETKTQLYNWKIVPVERGQVSIYFPADKETSKLRFHLHAPFASTVARDSVRDCKANLQLRDSLAELIFESLFNIRDRGMLTMGFIALLPIQIDNLSLFYEPIREAIVRAFKDEALMPTRNGSHAPATGLYRGPVSIAEVLDDDDLSLLTNYESSLWAANPPQLNQREDRFLDSLAIASWSWSELLSTVSSLDEERRAFIEEWIKQKDDSWMLRFYALLGEACDRSNAVVEVKDLCLVRVDAVQRTEHVLPQDAFFPPEANAISSENLRFVKPTVYSSGRSDSQKKYAVSFLERIGVRPYDAKTIIELRLGHYPKPQGKADIDHYEDMKDFISFWKKNPSDVDIFKNCAFLLGISDEGLLYWLKPENLCVDVPYIETGLAELTNIHKKYVLWNGYSEELIDGFTDFIKAIGVMHGLDVSKADIHANPNKVEWLKAGNETHTGIYIDYSIDSLESYLKVRSVAASQLIWQAIIRADRSVIKAKYRPNQAYLTQEGDSQLVHHLKSFAWVPSKNGDFHKPQDITRDELPTDYPYDDRNGLLTAICFSEQAIKRSDEYVSQNHHAKCMGFDSAEEAKKMAELAQLIRKRGESPDKLLKQFMSSSDQQQTLFPIRSVPNPEQRQERLGEQLTDAPDKEYEKRERSVRTTNGAIDPITWLRNQYTNEAGQMVCQICKEEMPFRKRDGLHYFEKKELLSKEYLSKEHEAQYLALCPLCAAKYDEFVKTEAEVMTVKKAILSAKDYEIPISLGDEQTSIRFVETHLRDLKVIMDEAK